MGCGGNIDEALALRSCHHRRAGRLRASPGTSLPDRNLRRRRPQLHHPLDEASQTIGLTDDRMFAGNPDRARGFTATIGLVNDTTNGCITTECSPDLCSDGVTPAVTPRSAPGSSSPRASRTRSSPRSPGPNEHDERLLRHLAQLLSSSGAPSSRQLSVARRQRLSQLCELK
jgi:hypothetical protein